MAVWCHPQQMSCYRCCRVWLLSEIPALRFAILLGTFLGLSHGWVAADQREPVGSKTWNESVSVITFFKPAHESVRFNPY